MNTQTTLKTTHAQRVPFIVRGTAGTVAVYASTHFAAIEGYIQAHGRGPVDVLTQEGRRFEARPGMMGLEVSEVTSTLASVRYFAEIDGRSAGTTRGPTREMAAARVAFRTIGPTLEQGTARVVLHDTRAGGHKVHEVKLALLVPRA